MAVFKKKLLFYTSTIAPLQPGAPFPRESPTEFITQIDIFPAQLDQGYVIKFYGGPPWQAASYPELKESVTSQVEPPRPDPGSAYAYASKVLIPNAPAISDFAFQAEAPPPYPGWVFTFSGPPKTQAASYPELKELVTVQTEPPQPDPGSVISSVSRSLIPDITTEIEVVSTENAPIYPGYAYAYAGPGVSTVRAYVNPILVTSSESPRPDAGYVINFVNRTIPATTSVDVTSVEVISSEAPPPNPGIAFYSVGPGTPKPTFLTPIYVVVTESPRPSEGMVITLASHTILPVSLIYPTIAVSEPQRPDAGSVITLGNKAAAPSITVTPPKTYASQTEPIQPDAGSIISVVSKSLIPTATPPKTYASQTEPIRPDSGSVIILNTIVSQLQKTTAGISILTSEMPRPEPGLVIISPGFISKSQINQTPTAKSQYIRQEFVQSAIGGDGAALITPSLTFSLPAFGGDSGDRYRRLRPQAKERMIKEAKTKKKHKQAVDFVSMLVTSGLLEHDVF